MFLMQGRARQSGVAQVGRSTGKEPGLGVPECQAPLGPGPSAHLVQNEDGSGHEV